jgi:cytoskeletal protein RodZ
MEVPMSGSMGSLVRSGVSGVRDGADAVSHTMGDVLDDMKSRVDDLVVMVHPRKVDARWRRGGGLLLAVVVVVAGAVLIRKRMLRTSTIGAHERSSSDGSAADRRADVPAASATDQHKTTASEDAGASASAKSDKSAKSSKSAAATRSPVSSTH